MRFLWSATYTRSDERRYTLELMGDQIYGADEGCEDIAGGG